MRATPEAYRLLQEGSLALAEVEAAGIRIDTAYLDLAITKLQEESAALERRLQKTEVWATWKGVYKEKANLGSLPQLGHVLFDVLKHECPGQTATGRHKVDDAALRGVDHPFVKKYLRLGDLRQMRSTFLEGIRREVMDGYLHPSFNLHTVKTYRSSSSDPNFQNFPIRDPEKGRIIRQAFIPRPGRVLVEVDYSGIEVRIAYCYHKDPTMRKYLLDPTTDMHRDMAGQIYKVDMKGVPKDCYKLLRYCAKNQFVFPEFYGSYYVDCARHLWQNAVEVGQAMAAEGLSLRDHLRKQEIKKRGECDPGREPLPGTFEWHIREVERDFWNNRFPVYRDWKKAWFDAYLKVGGFRTLTGFWIDGFYGRNDVINYPVQGSAFHCLLWSLIRIVRLLQKKKFRAKVVGQIHDSILLDVPWKELQDVLHLVKRVMTVDLLKTWPWIIVPLDVEADVAEDNWYGKKPWVEKEGTWVLAA